MKCQYSQLSSLKLGKQVYGKELSLCFPVATVWTLARNDIYITTWQHSCHCLALLSNFICFKAWQLKLWPDGFPFFVAGFSITHSMAHSTDSEPKQNQTLHLINSQTHTHKNPYAPPTHANRVINTGARLAEPVKVLRCAYKRARFLHKPLSTRCATFVTKGGQGHALKRFRCSAPAFHSPQKPPAYHCPCIPLSSIRQQDISPCFPLKAISSHGHEDVQRPTKLRCNGSWNIKKT